MNVLYDSYGRPFKSLRISITYACNFNCFFCHREGIDGLIKDELEWYEFSIIARIARKLGAEDVKITGGEPLLKKGLVELISELNNYGYENIGVSTNGYLLRDQAKELVQAGLKRINVSLHSLNRERFKLITGVDALNRVLEGLMEVKEYDIPVFINFTVLKGINDKEIFDIIKFAINNDFNIHLIELHPVGKAKSNFNIYHTFPQEVLKFLETQASRVEVRPLHYRLRYIVSGSVIEIVQPVSNPLFCAGCMRIRVSPDGKLYPCLNSFSEYVDTKEILRNPYLSENEKVQLIEDAFLKVNEMRKPYNLWNLDYEKNFYSNYTDEVKRLRKRISRLYIPKRMSTKVSRNSRSKTKMGLPNS
nr:GTP 3',8-cyclase MoaA [Ignicoccus islandicus]